MIQFMYIVKFRLLYKLAEVDVCCKLYLTLYRQYNIVIRWRVPLTFELQGYICSLSRLNK